MISNQETFNLGPYMAIYNIVVPKDNMLRQINDLVDFSFVLVVLKNNYCHDNDRNANARGHDHICGQPQTDYHVNEGSRVRKIKGKGDNSFKIERIVSFLIFKATIH